MLAKRGPYLSREYGCFSVPPLALASALALALALSLLLWYRRCVCVRPRGKVSLAVLFDGLKLLVRRRRTNCPCVRFQPLMNMPASPVLDEEGTHEMIGVAVSILVLFYPRAWSAFSPILPIALATPLAITTSVVVTIAAPVGLLIRLLLLLLLFLLFLPLIPTPFASEVFGYIRWGPRP
jgi:hypothetical protein